ncbi:MAG: cobamide remodeling phosphodiesterase CbiR [Pseudomonadota bacterium]
MDVTGHSCSREKPERPFRLGTTSFIFPDAIVPNVKRLGRCFDEIELLVFESRPEAVLPSPAEVRELGVLSRDLDVSYNIHLPVDISLTDEDPGRRIRGIDTLVRVMDLFSPLNPTTHTLHLDMDRAILTPVVDPVRLRAWQDRADDSLARLCNTIPDPGLVSIETLDYPFGHLDGLIPRHGLSVCIDAGHLIRRRYPMASLFDQYDDRIPIIHLHGVDFSRNPPRDHQGLDKTPDNALRETLLLLERFTGVLSLEVFNAPNLIASIRTLERFWRLCGHEPFPSFS